MVEAKYQPVKIAAAEAQWETCQPCSFSPSRSAAARTTTRPTQIIQIPHLLSLLATNSWNGEVKGLNQIQKEDEKKYGPGNYVPERLHPVLVDADDGLHRDARALLTLWAGWLLQNRQAR